MNKLMMLMCDLAEQGIWYVCLFIDLSTFIHLIRDTKQPNRISDRAYSSLEITRTIFMSWSTLRVQSPLKSFFLVLSCPFSYSSLKRYRRTPTDVNLDLTYNQVS